MNAHQAHLEALKLSQEELAIDRFVTHDLKKIREGLHQTYIWYAELVKELNIEFNRDLKAANAEKISKLKEENMLLSINLREGSKIMNLCEKLRNETNVLEGILVAIKNKEIKHLHIDKKHMIAVWTQLRNKGMA